MRLYVGNAADVYRLIVIVIIIIPFTVISLSFSVSGVIELLQNVSNSTRGHWTTRDTSPRSIALVFNDNIVRLKVDR